MKRLLVLFIVIFVSMIISAQTITLHCYQSAARNQNTGYVTPWYSVDFNISFDDYTMWVGDANTYTFSGGITHTSSTQFYVYAYDKDGIRCRVWFQAQASSRALVGIEYSDIAFTYKTTIR